MNKKMFRFLSDKDQGRIFEAFLYPDSASLDDVVFFCKSRSIPVVISPLHDLDAWTQEEVDEHDLEYPEEVGKYHVGDLKKPHYHVLFVFLGYKSGRQIKEICEILGLVRPCLMHDKVHRLRYLCHFDDPDKPFYNPEDVIVVGNLNYQYEIEKSVDDMPILKEIEAFVRQEHILSYADLKDYCAVYQPQWYEAITKRNTLSMLSYLKSLAYQPKLESIELEYKCRELHDEIDKLTRKRDALRKKEAERSSQVGCTQDPVPLKGVVSKKNKPC